MDRKVILASLKAITYASGRAYVALSKGDSAAYLNDLALLSKTSPQFMLSIGFTKKSSDITLRKTTKRTGGRRFATRMITSL